MKRVGVVAVVLAATSAVSAAATLPTLASVSAKVTRVWNANSCCTKEWVFQGRATIPSLGPVRFSGTYDLQTPLGPPQQAAVLALTFVTPDGQTVTIGGHSQFFAIGAPPPTASWTVIRGTRGLTRATGSGRYGVSGLDTTTLHFSFTGAIKQRRPLTSPKH
jgi:hypothetical protein